MFQGLKGIFGIGNPNQVAKKGLGPVVSVKTAPMQDSVAAPAPTSASAEDPQTYGRKRRANVIHGLVLTSVEAENTDLIDTVAVAPVDVVSSDSSVVSARTTPTPTGEPSRLKAAASSSSGKSSKRKSKSKKYLQKEYMSQRGRSPSPDQEQTWAGLNIPRNSEKLHKVTLRPLPVGYTKHPSGVLVSTSGKHKASGTVKTLSATTSGSAEGESGPMSTLPVPEIDMQQTPAGLLRDPLVHSARSQTSSRSDYDAEAAAEEHAGVVGGRDAGGYAGEYKSTKEAAAVKSHKKSSHFQPQILPPEMIQQLKTQWMGCNSTYVAQAFKLTHLLASLWNVHIKWAVCHILNTVNAERLLCQLLTGQVVDRKDMEHKLQCILYDGRTSFNECHVALAQAEEALRSALSAFKSTGQKMLMGKNLSLLSGWDANAVSLPIVSTHSAPAAVAATSARGAAGAAAGGGTLSSDEFSDTLFGSTASGTCSTARRKDTVSVVSQSLNSVSMNAYEVLFQLSFFNSSSRTKAHMHESTAAFAAYELSIISPRRDVADSLWEACGPPLINAMESLWDGCGIDAKEVAAEMLNIIRNDMGDVEFDESVGSPGGSLASPNSLGSPQRSLYTEEGALGSFEFFDSRQQLNTLYSLVHSDCRTSLSNAIGELQNFPWELFRKEQAQWFLQIDQNDFKTIINGADDIMYGPLTFITTPRFKDGDAPELSDFTEFATLAQSIDNARQSMLDAAAATAAFDAAAALEAEPESHDSTAVDSPLTVPVFSRTESEAEANNAAVTTTAATATSLPVSASISAIAPAKPKFRGFQFFTSANHPLYKKPALPAVQADEAASSAANDVLEQRRLALLMRQEKKKQEAIQREKDIALMQQRQQAAQKQILRFRTTKKHHGNKKRSEKERAAEEKQKAADEQQEKRRVQLKIAAEKRDYQQALEQFSRVEAAVTSKLVVLNVLNKALHGGEGTSMESLKLPAHVQPQLLKSQSTPQKVSNSGSPRDQPASPRSQESSRSKETDRMQFEQELQELYSNVMRQQSDVAAQASASLEQIEAEHAMHQDVEDRDDRDDYSARSGYSGQSQSLHSTDYGSVDIDREGSYIESGPDAVARLLSLINRINNGNGSAMPSARGGELEGLGEASLDEYGAASIDVLEVSGVSRTDSETLLKAYEDLAVAYGKCGDVYGARQATDHARLLKCKTPVDRQRYFIDKLEEEDIVDTEALSIAYSELSRLQAATGDKAELKFAEENAHALIGLGDSMVHSVHWGDSEVYIGENSQLLQEDSQVSTEAPSQFDPTNISRYGKYAYIPNDSQISQDVPSQYGSAIGLHSNSVDTLLNGPNWSMSLATEDKASTQYTTGQGVKLVYKSIDSRPTVNQLLAETGGSSYMQPGGQMEDSLLESGATTSADGAGIGSGMRESKVAFSDQAAASVSSGSPTQHPQQLQAQSTADSYDNTVYLDNSLMETSIATTSGFGKNYPKYHHPQDPILNEKMQSYINQIICKDKEDDDASIDHKEINNQEYDNKVEFLPAGIFEEQSDVHSSDDDDDDSEDNSVVMKSKFFDPINKSLTVENMKAHTEQFTRYNHDKNENMPFYNGSEQEDRFADASVTLPATFTKFDKLPDPNLLHVPAPINLRPDMLEALSKTPKWSLTADEGKVLFGKNEGPGANVFLTPTFAKVTELEEAMERAMLIGEDGPKPVNVEHINSSESVTTSVQAGRGIRTPILDWEHPEDITYPAPLTTVQLCCAAYDPLSIIYPRAPVEGRMIYDPPLGTILPSGHSSLSVTFIPARLDNFRSVSLTRKITQFVHKGNPDVIWPPFDDVLVQGNPLDDRFFMAHTVKLVAPTVFNQKNTKERLAALEAKRQRKEYKKKKSDKYKPPRKWTHEPGGKKTEFSDVNADEDAESEPESLCSQGSTSDDENQNQDIDDDGSVPIEQASGPSPLKQKKKEVSFVIDEPYSNEFLFKQAADALHDGEEFHYSHEPGLILARGLHKLHLQYRPSKEMAKHYHNGYRSITVVVGARAPKVEWITPYDIKYLDEVSHRAFKVSIDEPPSVLWNEREMGPWPGWGKFTCEPPVGTKLDVGVHKLTVRFTSAFPLEFRDTLATNTLTVLPKESVIEWANLPFLYDKVPIGPGHLNCKVEIPTEEQGGGTFEYSVQLGDTLPIGTHIITCKFTPTRVDRFCVAETSQEITVNKPRTPTMWWQDPDEIIYPEPLGKAQLNARVVTLGCAGKLVFEPPLWTVLDAGEHVLTATMYPDLVSWTTATISVKIVVKKAIVRLSWGGPFALIEQKGLHHGILDCRVLNDDLKGTLKYTPPFSSVLDIGEHRLHCLFTPDEANIKNYSPTEAWASLTVRAKPKKRTTLEWKNPPAIVHPTTLNNIDHLNATCNETKGTFSYNPRPGSSLNVGKHEIKVKFTPDREEEYLQSEEKVVIHVSKGSCSLSWDPKPELLEFDYGSPINRDLLCAKCNSQLDTNVPGEFIYTLNKIVLEKDQILDCGAHEIICSFIPAVQHNFSPCPSVSIFIQVYRLTPELVWQAPEDAMTYPSLIDKNLHLCCVCTDEHIQGTMKYSVAVGDILPVGYHQLFVRFEPDDIINYYSKDASIVIQIDKGTPLLAEWKFTSEMVYPEPISKVKHLSADSDLDNCTYTYNVEMGDVLSVGCHEITCVISASADEINNYETMTVKKILTVTPTACKIVWDGPSPLEKQYEIRYGEPLSDSQLCAYLVLDDVREQDLPLLTAKENDLSAITAELMKLNPKTQKEEIKLKESTLKYLSNQQVGLNYNPRKGSILTGGKHKITCTFVPPTQCVNIRLSNTVKMNIVVTKSVPKIRWPKLPNIKYGELLSEKHLCAGIHHDNPELQRLFAKGNFRYKHDIGTLLRVGLTKLECKYMPDDFYSLHENTATQTITVDKCPAVITWDDAPIVVPYKYKLKASDLCAKVLGIDGKQVEGMFQYVPAVSQTLGAMGTQEIRCEFFPRGMANKCYTMPRAITVKVQVVPPDSSSTGVATFRGGGAKQLK